MTSKCEWRRECLFFDHQGSRCGRANLGTSLGNHFVDGAPLVAFGGTNKYHPKHFLALSVFRCVGTHHTVRGAGSIEGMSSVGNSFGVMVSYVLTLDGSRRAVVQVPRLVKRRSREGKQAKVLELFETVMVKDPSESKTSFLTWRCRHCFRVRSIFRWVCSELRRGLKKGTCFHSQESSSRRRQPNCAPHPFLILPTN